ncbi:MAG TPA: asparagine--tRNA ligase, partial [Anaerolineae bacterium]|nr:asparagine--tRNA ligase [Anaerolineae bacterium]
RQHAIIRVRHEIIKAVRDYFDSNGFTLVDTPIFTPSACEGTTTLFEVNYFDDDKAYLTQSGQLYNEANAMAFGQVYCFGPTFRAEKSKTRRHLSEFWMVEPEWAFGTLEEYMDVAEQLVVYIVQTVLETRKTELQVLERDTAPLERVVSPFPRISYDDAVKLIQEKGDANFKWGDDFGAPDETIISEQFDRPVFVHHYPTAMKAFYMEPQPDRPEVCLSADLLAPEGYGEIIGGGQRTASLEYLEAQIKKHNLPREAYEWYLDLRKYGSVPHCGFGLGIERTLAWLGKLDHVRETIPYPRMLEKMYP